MGAWALFVFGQGRAFNYSTLSAAFALKHDPGAGRAEDMRLKEGDETAIMLMRIIDKATRENDGGTFTFYDGSQLPW